MAATSKNKSSRQDRPNFAAAVNETVKPMHREEVKQETPVASTKAKGGRPSNGEVKRITLAIPVELYEQMEYGANLFHKGNKTAYINALIKKDLDDNLEKYKEFQKISQEK